MSFWQLHTEPGWARAVLYGSTSGAAGGKRSTDGLGGSSYEAEEYSYQLSGAADDGYETYALAGTGASTSLTGSRPLTACGTSRALRPHNLHSGGGRFEEPFTYLR